MQTDNAGKALRQNRILRLVHSRPIRSQLELGRLLLREGIGTTQATLSRDLRELNLVKTMRGYRLPGELTPARDGETQLRQTLGQFLSDVDAAGSLVVVKTSPDSAHPVALSLDGSGWKEIVGTLAGDDTVLVVARNVLKARELKKRILALTGR